jgi:MFS family permease
VAFIVGTGAWLTLNATVGVFASHFKTLNASATAVNATILLASLLALPLFPVLGAAGQRFGRRRVFMTLGTANLLIGPVLFGAAVASARAPAAVIACGAATLLLTLMVWSVITAYLTELFPTAIRSSGYGIAYSLPSVIPAFYPYYLLGLSALLPYAYTPLVLLALGGLCMIIGAVLSRDLRHVELADTTSSPR